MGQPGTEPCIRLMNTYAACRPNDCPMRARSGTILVNCNGFSQQLSEWMRGVDYHGKSATIDETVSVGGHYGAILEQ